MLVTIPTFQTTIPLPIATVALNEICACSSHAPFAMRAELDKSIGVVSLENDRTVLAHIGAQSYLDRSIPSYSPIKFNTHGYFVNLAMIHGLPLTAPCAKGFYLDVMLGWLDVQHRPQTYVVAPALRGDEALLTAFDVLRHVEKLGIAAVFRQGTGIVVMPKEGK